MEQVLHISLQEKPVRSPSSEPDRTSKKSEVGDDRPHAPDMELDTCNADAGQWGATRKQLFPDGQPGTSASQTSTEVSPAGSTSSSDVPNLGGEPRAPMSFKDKLLQGSAGHGGLSPEAEDDTEFQVAPEDVQIVKDGPIPSITFSRRVLSFLEECMEYAVVVKLLDRFVRQDILYVRLNTLWEPAGGLKLTELDSGCYMVKLFNAADYQHALLGGPWVVQGHYLTVHPWEPTFSPQNLEIKQVVCWVRLPGLPYHYYHKHVLRTIGDAIGHVFKIDYNTIGVSKARFARMAVKVDLTQPLVSMVHLDGITQFVEYEGLPTICYGCGRYGHLEPSCPQKVTEPATSPGVPPPRRCRLTPEQNPPAPEKKTSRTANSLGCG